MLLLNFLLVLLTFFDLTVAFYPFFPPYRCIYNDTCAAEKREVQAESYSLKIVQRVRNVNLSWP